MSDLARLRRWSTGYVEHADGARHRPTSRGNTELVALPREGCPALVSLGSASLEVNHGKFFVDRSPDRRRSTRSMQVAPC